MSPAYFSLVMATGIVSLAAFLMDRRGLAVSLFYLNIAQYAVLCVLYGIRAVRHPRRFFGDMIAHASGPGYFTAVAGTGILASQFMAIGANVAIGTGLWLLAGLLWVCLTYTIFPALTVRREKPTLDTGINGGWLLAVVATQAMAVSSALLASLEPPHHPALNLLALSMWLWGGMLYIWMMSLIFYRYTFFPLSPGDLAPSYWINMGAMAISTLAGCQLILNAPQAPYLASLLPFLKGFTILYWSVGTWWIPMLLVLGLWRYGYKRFPLRYDPIYWSVVFPLGMYAACTWQIERAMAFGFLDPVSHVLLYIALAAWAITFLGMIHALVCGHGRQKMDRTF
ncbi:tellurite resistance/C4-dicarboxylate transporter family protein [Hephaestia sp. GCM10023244]|uniref:tellurite resistance/C4-dicarboxylate transporter family protein n=1 Tax=unclassified Hephaestia TaxID=2631281 RepID=UPI0020778D03|nr:tellurite resistance/C4-dicarboxylate transporter family protein [Hephaestia sp. MAHUQ-44]MCM8729791.1 tellurite resistance/C4-dicarboxylate transporter family protein [Hephaestia sp. MAHUQ-44]